MSDRGRLEDAVRSWQAANDLTDATMVDCLLDYVCRRVAESASHACEDALWHHLEDWAPVDEEELL